MSLLFRQKPRGYCHHFRYVDERQQFLKEIEEEVQLKNAAQPNFQSDNIAQTIHNVRPIGYKNARKWRYANRFPFLVLLVISLLMLFFLIILYM